MSSKLRCDVVEYRKGFLEVEPGIHDGCINLEAWQVHPDIDISDMDVSDGSFPDDDAIGNVELEMSIAAAEDLIRMLQEAVRKMRSS